MGVENGHRGSFYYTLFFNWLQQAIKREGGVISVIKTGQCKKNSTQRPTKLGDVDRITKVVVVITKSCRQRNSLQWYYRVCKYLSTKGVSTICALPTGDGSLQSVLSVHQGVLLLPSDVGPFNSSSESFKWVERPGTGGVTGRDSN